MTYAVDRAPPPRYGDDMQKSAKDGCIAAATAADKRRFWKKVHKTKTCWLWTGCRRKGYGDFWVQGHNVRAHRAAKIWSHGKRKMDCFCCHRCNNPGCVRPSHIYWGTSAQNSSDMVELGVHCLRVHRGSKSSRAKLTEALAQQIVNEYVAGGVSSYALAKKHGVSRGAVDSILRGKNWKHAVVLPKDGMNGVAGAYKKGAECHLAVLTEQKVLRIREMRARGTKQREIAAMFGVSETNISAICRRATWGHLPD